ncbi:hypothetical protein BCR43DRAFT_499623 [Syncephalastrum racemosum]|uniref:Uncharacterized protein n=1 Tax=Syncephalastrum racemosum TaxID=13706 RepID=A0A1X2GZA4_SYNRA|nr:hypothetical protein BCR43DRAFT_499623 [Syncephalastrum racemosum]
MSYYPTSPQQHRRRRSSAPQESPYHPRQSRHTGGSSGNNSSNNNGKRRSSAGQVWYPYHHDLPLPANDDEYYYEEHPSLHHASYYNGPAAVEDEPEWYDPAPHSVPHPYRPRQQQQQQRQAVAAATAAAAAVPPPPIYDEYYHEDDPQPLRDREQVEDEDEEDAVSPQEQLAAENAIRNRVLAFQDSIDLSLPKSSRSPSDDELSSTARPSSSGPSNAPLLPHEEQEERQRQQQQHILADAHVREVDPRTRKRRFSFGNLMKRITPKKLIKMRTHASIAPQRNIQTIASTGPTGDVLSEQQQQEIINKLVCRDTLHPPRTYSPAAAMITGLDCIWVFRLVQDRHHDMDVWTGFDMANQTLLSQKQHQHQHQHQQSSSSSAEGEGIEIFDSHIRQGQLPVLVIPERQLGYFPLDMTGNQIGTLQIACLPNNNEVQFVYRQQQQQHASRF